MNSVDTSKKRAKRSFEDFLFKYGEFILTGETNPSTIAKLENTKVQNIVYYYKRLKNYVKKVGYGTYEIINPKKFEQLIEEVKNRSLGMSEKPKINLHALQIEIPILEDNSKDDIWDYESEMKNWLAKYKKIEHPIGLTLRKTPKNVILYLHKRNLENLSDMTPLLMKAVIFTYHYLLEKGIKLDILEAKSNNLHITISDKFLQNLPKGTVIEVNLDKKPNQILEKDTLEEAKVWTDASPYRGVETNDIDYASKYLMMPEMVFKLQQSLPRLNESIEREIYNKQLHEAVLKDMREIMKQLPNAVANAVKDALKEVYKNEPI